MIWIWVWLGGIAFGFLVVFPVLAWKGVIGGERLSDTDAVCFASLVTLLWPVALAVAPLVLFGIGIERLNKAGDEHRRRKLKEADARVLHAQARNLPVVDADPEEVLPRGGVVGRAARSARR